MAAQPGGEACSVFWQIGELDAMIGQNGVNPVGNCRHQGIQEGNRSLGCCALYEAGEGKL